MLIKCGITLYRLVQKAKKGEIPKEKPDECYRSWKAHAAHGNTYKLIQRMDAYYKNLWKEAEMNIITKPGTTPKVQRQMEDTQAMLEKLEANQDYIAMMSDIKLEDDTEGGTDE